MNDKIQRGIIEVGVDAAGVKAGIADANKALSSLEQHASDAADKAGKGFDRLSLKSSDLSGIIGRDAARIVSAVSSVVSMPVAAATAAIAALGSTYYAGASESARLNKALIATGNAAGTATEELSRLAGEVGRSAQSYSTARSAVEALAASGKVGFGQMEAAAKAVTYGVGLTGRSVQELVGDIESISGSPTKAIAKLNEQYNFLTIETYNQIKALEKQGKVQEAARVATELYSNTLAERSAQVKSELGHIEMGWLEIKAATLGAIDAMKEWGRQSGEKSLREQISGLQDEEARLAALGSLTEKQRDSIKSTIAARTEEISKIKEQAVEQAKANQEVKAAVKLDQENEKKRGKKSRTSPEETAYQRLISSINQKIDANKLEIVTGQAVTEAEKMQLKYTHDLGAGKIKLTESQKASTQALLDDLFVKERQSLASKALFNAEKEHQRIIREMNDDYKLQIDSIGKTAEEVEKLTAKTKILTAAREKIISLENKGIVDPGLNAQIMKNAEEQIAQAQENIGQRYEKERDPWIGLTESVRRYGEEAGKQGEQIGNAFNNAMSSAEDAWVEFVRTGKLSFKGLINSIVADMARAQFQSMAKSLLGGLFGNASGGSTGGGFDFGSVIGSIGSFFSPKALGGPVTAGTPYLVGEKGPELFMPSASGSIVPNDRASGAASVTFAPTINIDSRSDRAQVMADTERMLRQSQAQLIDKLERQGRLN